MPMPKSKYGSLALAVLGLWLGPVAMHGGLPAQDEPKRVERVVCRACKNKGGLDCKKHSRRELEMEREPLLVYCSKATLCEVCGGALITDCKICRNEAVEAAAAEKKRLAKEWLAERREKVDKFVHEKNLLHGKTKHVDLAFSIPPMKVEGHKEKLSTHELMHLYLRRLEALRSKFCEILELTDQDFTKPLDIYMFKNLSSHMEMAPRVTGGSGGHETGKKFMGDHMVYCMYLHRSKIKDDEDLYRNIVHNTTHLLVNHMSGSQWIFNKKYGWVDAGLAHYFEYLLTGRCTNFCYEEVALDPGQGYKSGKWRVAVRKLVETGRAPKFTSFYMANTDQLGLQAHAMSFAYVDFLISKYGGSKMRDLIRLVKKKVSSRDALKQAFGIKILEIDEEFQTWVRAEYPLQEK